MDQEAERRVNELANMTVDEHRGQALRALAAAETQPNIERAGSYATVALAHLQLASAIIVKRGAEGRYVADVNSLTWDY